PDGEPVVLHVDRGHHRIDHLEVDHRVHTDRDVVPRDAVLCGHRRGHDLHVDLLYPVGDRDQPGDARLPYPRTNAAEPEHQPALELLHDTHARGEPGDSHDADHRYELHQHGASRASRCPWSNGTPAVHHPR